MEGTLYGLTSALQSRKMIGHGDDCTFVVGFLLREVGRFLLYGTHARPVKFEIGEAGRNSLPDGAETQWLLSALPRRDPRKQAVSRRRLPTTTCRMFHFEAQPANRFRPAQLADAREPRPIDSLLAQGYSILNGCCLHVGCEHSVGFHLQRESASRN
jgi:hypothetical protein